MLDEHVEDAQQDGCRGAAGEEPRGAQHRDRGDRKRVFDAFFGAYTTYRTSLGAAPRARSARAHRKLPRSHGACPVPV